jgi:phosphohistidine phosphatase
VLVVMRHAKAEPYADADRDRSLTARGRADAAACGRQLASWGLAPDHVVVSSAARTLETWSLVEEQLAGDPVVEVSEAMYAASADTALEALRLVPDEHRTVLLVGHNPCVAYLATVLHDGNGDPEALRRLLAGFPPAAAAVLELEDGWAELGEGTTRLTHVHTP